MPEALTIRDVMTPDFVGVTEGDSIGDVIEVLSESNTRGVLVQRGSDVVGVVDEGDLLDHLVDDGGVDDGIDSIVRPPPMTVRAQEDLLQFLSRMPNEDLGLLPVLDDEDSLAGVLSMADLLSVAASQLTAITAVSEPTSEPGNQSPMETPPSATPADTSTMSVCESCGTLSQDIQEFNGQMLCQDCRSVQ